MRSLQKSVLISSLVITIPTIAARLPRAAPICGQAGYSGDTDAYFYDDENVLNTLHKCQKHCYNDPQCKSITFSKQTCMHYAVGVAGNFDADSDSPYVVYDRDCYTPNSPNSPTFPKSSTSLRQNSAVSVTTTVTTTSRMTGGASPASPTTMRSSTTNKATMLASSSKTTLSTTARKTSTTSSSARSSTTAVASPSANDKKAVPPGCAIPTSFVISSFHMFNSTHNLDCVNGPDLGDGTGCLKDGKWCDPKTDTKCTQCGINVCSTGLPLQPIGYGPPDNVKITFDDGTSCEQSNPQSIHRAQVGEGFVQCGGSYPFLYFYGSSVASKNTGHIHVNGLPSTCSDGRTITGYYDGYFDYPCIRDTKGNATCTYDKQISVPLTGFSIN